MSRAEYINCATYKIIDYFDVWADEESGWQVNNLGPVDGYENIVVSDECSDADLLEGLDIIGWLKIKGVQVKDIVVDWLEADLCEFSLKENDYPLFRMVGTRVY